MLLQWLENLTPAVWLRHSEMAYLLVNAAHIASLGMLVGTIVSLDLLLLGIYRGPPLNQIAPFLSRMAATGLALAIATGLWLFSVKATEYAGNPAFLAKICLVILGAANALWLHASKYWREGLEFPRMPTPVRAHAAASLLIWLGAVVAGRWIGFL
ncbi:DUF6644 family protein [Pollutimonas sp. H1-120]|uniref:DUF6644 family protein n=1 Tax=Pollutimonas sp. H1-120 TaxID=3148824 RepID=UPI003B51E755